jgi:hypothetical protein
MKKTHPRKKPLSAEAIAHMADCGKDVSRFFSNSGMMMKPIRRVNVDFTAAMLEELENAAAENASEIDAKIREGYAAAQRGELLDAESVRRSMNEKKRAWLSDQRKK